MSADPCNKLLEGALQMSKKDVEELKSRSVEWRVQKYNDLKTNQEKYEDGCSANLTFAQRVSDLGYFMLGRLKLAGSFKLAQPEPVVDASLQKMLDEFSQNEYDALGKLDRFSKIDYLTKEDIKTALFNRSGQIYFIVKQWYDEQMDEFEKLLNPLSSSGVKGFLTAALKQEYNDRFEKIRAGIVEYMAIDRGAPRMLFHSYEDVLMKTYGAELDRQSAEQKAAGLTDSMKIGDIEQRLETLRGERASIVEALDSLETLKGENVNQDTLAGYASRNEELAKKIDSLILDLESKVEELQQSASQLKPRQAELRSLLQTAKPEERAVIEGQLVRIDETNNMLATRMSELGGAISRLRLEKVALGERIALLRKSLEGGEENRFVRVDQARSYELNFIGRLETKVTQSGTKFLDPIRKGEFVPSRDELHHSHADLEDHLTTDLRVNPKDLPTYPHNTNCTFEAVKKRFLREDLKAVITSTFLSHIDTYAKLGFDTRPIVLADFLRLMDAIGKVGDTFRVVGVCSATGFDEGVKGYVSSDDFHRNFVSQYVAMCLVDWETGEVIHNRLDERIAPFIPLFEPEFDREKQETVKKFINEQRYTEPVLILSKVASTTGVDTHIVKKAFYDLEKAGQGNVYRVGEDLALKASEAK